MYSGLVESSELKRTELLILTFAHLTTNPGSSIPGLQDK